MRPDVIVAWPRTCDYPLWRKFIHEERARFERVIVALTKHDGDDLTRWVLDQWQYLGAQFVWSESPGDWRDRAVNEALEHSGAEWVWFTEQDFLIHRPRTFWATIEVASVAHEALGIGEAGSGRWHPSCLFVTREAIDRTSCDFGPDPIDHFYRFGTELPDVYDLERTGGLVAGLDFEHLQGTTQNHWLIDSGIEPGVFRRERFHDYLRQCLEADVPLHPDWERRAREELKRGTDHPVPRP